MTGDIYRVYRGIFGKYLKELLNEVFRGLGEQLYRDHDMNTRPTMINPTSARFILKNKNKSPVFSEMLFYKNLVLFQ